MLVLLAMGTALLMAGGVAYALSVQCGGAGDQDPAPGECWGTNENDVITGTAQADTIRALRGLDEVTALAGDDHVQGLGGRDDISGGGGGDLLAGGPQADDIYGGSGTTDEASEPPNKFRCTVTDPVASAEGDQVLDGGGGNDRLTGGRDNDLLRGGSGTNDLSGEGGGDCLSLFGDANERASGGFGDDIIISVADGNGDDVFCGPGHDTVEADAEDRVAANCEDVRSPSPLRAAGATAEAEVTINMAPEESGS